MHLFPSFTLFVENKLGTYQQVRIISLIASLARKNSFTIIYTCCNTLKITCYLLTIINFFNYSDRMDADLKALEEKLSGLISLCSDLRSENAQLRLDLNATQNDAALLKANMAQASERIEALMERLP